MVAVSRAQFKRADRSDALFALVLGEDEILNGQVTVKFLRSGEAAVEPGPRRGRKLGS